ncbi:cytochrome P450 [Streptomyces sp. NPDC059853]|uniref:cytochrome P450 n=1 Tax=Streptomyces sp. NPDC059853 TaxID=3346973 RepID=UPI0036542BC1
MEPQPRFDGPPPGCPAHQGDGGGEQQGVERVPLYGPEFAANPHAFYDYLRDFGPAGPVELAPGVDATLVTDYSAALHVLQNPDTFVRDARRWRALNEGTLSPDHPIMALMGYRPNALFADGAQHVRLRPPVADSLARLDAYRVNRTVEKVSTYLVNQFSHRGSVDLLNEYAKELTFLVFNEFFGCPPEIGDNLIHGFTTMFDGTGDAVEANEVLSQTLYALSVEKRKNPGDDVTTWMIEHPSQLNDEEIAHQLAVTLGAGIEAERNLIAAGLMLMLSDERYFGGIGGGGLLVEDALTEVLWNDPPIANYATHFPVRDVDLGGVPLRANDPVVISFAGANTDPAVSGSQVVSRRAHLAWGAGPHACPAKDSASLIAVGAIERLLNQLPDIELAVPVESLQFRQGAVHRALSTLPTRFTPVRRQRQSAGAEHGAPAQGKASGQPAAKGGLWSSFLSWWRV